MYMYIEMTIYSVVIHRLIPNVFDISASLSFRAGRLVWVRQARIYCGQ